MKLPATTTEFDWLRINESPVFSYKENPHYYNGFLSGKRQGIVNGVITGLTIGIVITSFMLWAISVKKDKKNQNKGNEK